MSGPGPMRPWRVIEATVLFGLVACDGAGRTTDGFGVGGHWITEAEYQIGNDTLFSWVPYLRVTADGHRVFVVEPNTGSVTVWTPEDSLIFAVGRRGEGPGEFIMPYRLHIHDDGSFYVRDFRRFTYFSATGELVRTVAGPPALVSYQGFRVQADALLQDGSYLGRPEIGAAVREGWQGAPPLVQEPLLRTRARRKSGGLQKCSRSSAFKHRIWPRAELWRKPSMSPNTSPRSAPSSWPLQATFGSARGKRWTLSRCGIRSEGVMRQTSPAAFFCRSGSPFWMPRKHTCGVCGRIHWMFPTWWAGDSSRASPVLVHGEARGIEDAAEGESG